MENLLNKRKAPLSAAQPSIEVGSHRSIAETIFRDLKSYGLCDKDIVAVSSEILNHLTVDIRQRNTSKNG